jgi:hypothetical protein
LLKGHPYGEDLARRGKLLHVVQVVLRVWYESIVVVQAHCHTSTTRVA